MKIWCAAGVNLTGGRTKDGGDIVGASVFYSAPPPEEHKAEEEDEISRLDAELKEGASLGLEAAEADQQLSSLVWICTSTHSISKVTVIDANNPADVLESFHVCSSHLLCIASVPGQPVCPICVTFFISPLCPKLSNVCPLSHCVVMAGAKEDDYVVDNELNKVIVEESAREADETKEAMEAREQQPDDPEKFTSLADSAEKTGLGSISFVSCATGADAIEQPPSLVSDAEEGNMLLFFSLLFKSVSLYILSSVSSYFSFVLFRGQAKAYKRNCYRTGYVLFLFLFFSFCPTAFY